MSTANDCMTARAFLDSLFRTAIAAAHPSSCLPPHLPPPPRAGRLIVLAAGKAAGSMAEVAEGFYTGQMPTEPSRLIGIAVARQGYGRPTAIVPMIGLLIGALSAAIVALTPAPIHAEMMQTQQQAIMSSQYATAFLIPHASQLVTSLIPLSVLLLVTLIPAYPVGMKAYRMSFTSIAGKCSRGTAGLRLQIRFDCSWSRSKYG